MTILMMITAEQATAYGTMLGIFLVAVLNQYNAYKAKKTAEAVSAALLGSDAAKGKKLDEIHTLVNSGMTEQLRTVMLMSRRIAEATHDPDDVATADQAQVKYQDHLEGQARADANAFDLQVAFESGIAHERARMSGTPPPPPPPVSAIYAKPLIMPNAPDASVRTPESKQPPASPVYMPPLTKETMLPPSGPPELLPPFNK